MNKKIGLKEIGDFLSKIAEKSENVYWLSSPDLKKIQYISPAYEKIWGRSIEPLYRNPELWGADLHPEDIKDRHPIHLFANSISVLGDKARYEESYRIIRPDGDIRWIIDRGFPIIDSNGCCCGVTGVAIDITKEKKAEELLTKAKQEAEIAKCQEVDLRRAVSVFAGSIAHDLRIPLTTQDIIFKHWQNKTQGIIDACKKTGVQPKDIVDELEKIMIFSKELCTSTWEMNGYINDSLKALNKTITGVKTYDDLVPCSLWKCIGNAIKAYPCADDEEKLIHWDRSVDFNFMGNPVAFHRIVSNLLKNSFDQIKERGQGEIYIKAQVTKNFKQLFIKDTAGGVTEKFVKNIFQEFHTSKREGTGIGLAFCKSVMISFGGDISCHLFDGDKVEFRLRFKNKDK